MDPLSITASTITLIQAACVVSGTLHELISTFTNADVRVSALCSELSTLISFLEAVDRTLKECRGQPLSLASMDEDMWYQSALSLADCKATLSDLGDLTNRIKASVKHTGFFARVKATVDLTMYARDLAGFQEKIHKSNWALQTMLSAIIISLSLRGNATQDTILYELGRLKRSIEQSLQVALRHNDGFSHTLGDPLDARVAQNLRNLARAAQNFHSSASSTASSINDANRTLDWNVQSDAAMSIRGTLTLNKREQIHQYLDQTQHETTPVPLQHIPSSIADLAAPLSKDDAGDDDNDDQDDEAEFESLFLSGLEEASKQSMLKHDFKKAEAFLEKAIQIQTGLASGDSDSKHLQIPLIICYFFQHKWRLAEPLITAIARSRANLDAVVCNLLHALALAHLSDYGFDEAIRVCKQALKGKKKLKETFGASHELDYNETLGLLATIHDIKGDQLYPEVLRRTMPQWFTYCHPFDEVEFISTHPTIFQGVLGEDTPPNWGQAHASRRQPVIAELPGTNIMTPTEEVADVSHSYAIEPTKPQTLQIQLDLYEKFEADTSKEVVASIPSSASDSDETGDEAFSPTNSDTSSRPPSSPGLVLRRSFTRSITRLLGSVRVRPTVSSDDLTVPQSPESEYVPSLPRRLSRRQRLRKSLSDSNLFSLKKSKTKLQKRASSRPAQKPTAPGEGHDGRFRVLRMEPIKQRRNETHGAINKPEPQRSRQDIDSFFGLRSEDYCHGDYDDGSSKDHPHYDDSFDNRQDTQWATASRILGSNPISHVEPPCDDAFDNHWDTHWDTASRIPRADPDSRVELPDNAVYTSRPSATLCNFTTENNQNYRNVTISGFNRQDTPETASKSRPRRPELAIIIPNSSKSPGWVPLVAHYPRQVPPSLIHMVNGVNDPPSHILIPRLPPSPPLSIKGDDFTDISGKEIECPLGSNQNGARISEEHTEEQHTGLESPESTPRNRIHDVKPNITTDEPLGRQLPPSPPESVRAEVGTYYALED
ncbi:hypothetical protein VE03_08939 [Pseudogymnoascus sp. 23342-1-I1]|nr:hypothetical protein VE03_08939 [Pseudogymnoascus sp. 23342-1-I1]